MCRIFNKRTTNALACDTRDEASRHRGDYRLARAFAVNPFASGTAFGSPLVRQGG